MERVDTPIAFEPVTLAEVKVWLRVDHAVDDALIEGLIAAARERAEHYTNTAFARRALEITAPAGTTRIRPSLGPVVSITSVTDDGILLPQSGYSILSSCADTVELAAPAVGEVVLLLEVGAATTPEEIPAVVRLAMQLMITEHYENRSDRIRKLPTATENLLNTVRRWMS
jgi:uncharacterized phiE125 gp8 family phage protein